MAIDWDAVVLAPAMAIFGPRPGLDPPTYWPKAAIGTDGFITLADAVFDEGFTAVILEDGAQVSTVMPCLGVRMAHFADLPGEPQQGGQAHIPGFGTYVVRDAQPDSHGHCLLLLNLMAPDT